jgi:hypothetical protein
MRLSKLNKLLSNNKINDKSYMYKVTKHFNFLAHRLPYE